MTGWHNGSWNFVFVGCENAPATHCSHTNGYPSSNIPATPVIAEKPYITSDGTSFYLQVPYVETEKSGPSKDYSKAKQIDFSQVYVATTKDTAATINAKLSTGLHLVITPGIYYLEDSIQVMNADTVVLGLGMATLVSAAGKPCIVVGNVDGVRVAGLLLQAGPVETPALLQWGTGGYAGDSSNPGVISDVFARVGGMNNPAIQQMTADVMVSIESGNVIYDNSWLWRADHDIIGEVYDSHNPVQTGLKVTGDNVTVYGLASEHTLGNLVEWYGNNGRVYFYQSEYPYDVT
jgi:hypothetical protein